jgi:Enterobacter phage Enc34, ssDNA-binding protein
VSDKKKNNIEAKKAMTPEFRVSFPHVFEAHTGFEGQQAKFSIVALFPKNVDLSGLKKAVFNAAVEKFGPKEKWPKNLRLPFRDGDEKSDLSGYEGTTYITASSMQRPGVVNQKLEPLTKDDNQFYAGCYARATLIAFAYDKAGNKGVSFSLQNVQKLRDGDPFSGRRKAEEEFDSVEDGSDDASNYGGEEASSDMGF